MVRWDSPLFTVLWTEEDIPGEQIWAAVTSGNIKPPNSGTLSVRFLAILYSCLIRTSFH